jgi:hypothetical protein
MLDDKQQHAVQSFREVKTLANYIRGVVLVAIVVLISLPN